MFTDFVAECRAMKQVAKSVPVDVLGTLRVKQVLSTARQVTVAA